MKTLLIDAGNTGLKWSLLSDGEISEQNRCNYRKNSPQDCFEEILSSHSTEIKEIYLVSVLGDAFIESIERSSEKHSVNLHNITSRKDLAGIENAYDEPHKLGADRLVAMIGARHHYQNEEESAFIIIDSGTATTVDAFDQYGKHYGGLILPGIDLCTQSLLKNTKQLPLWGAENDGDSGFKPEIFSKSTAQAIQSASIFGLAGAIDSICTKMKSEISKDVQVKTILCGGNTDLLQPYLDSGYILNENLIMLGLKAVAGLQTNKTL